MGRGTHFINGHGDGSPEFALAAKTYAHRMGQERPDDFSRVTANPVFAKRLAAAYEAAPDFDPAALPAFKAMAEQTKRQFEFLTGARGHGGLGIDVQVQKEDPYANAGELVHDMRENHRLKIFGTGGEGNTHPLFSNDENDQFRAVHDAFGHAAIGRGFDRHGEEAAYRSHASMYTPKARPALATETRAQNSVNVANPGTFAAQKIVTLPGAGKIVPIGSRSQARAALLQARQFHVQAFGDQNRA